MTEQHFYQMLALARDAGEPQRIVEEIAYAGHIGMTALCDGDGTVIYRLEKRKDNIGNQSLPAIHGGVIGGFMELAATIEILYGMDTPVVPRVIDFSIDYLRAARFKDSFASCTVLRQGSRVINVSVNAWQDSPDVSIATARCHFLLDKKSSAA